MHTRGDTILRFTGVCAILLLAMMSPICFGLVSSVEAQAESAISNQSVFTSANAALAMMQTRMQGETPADHFSASTPCRSELSGAGHASLFCGLGPNGLAMANDAHALGEPLDTADLQRRCALGSTRLLR